MKIFHILAAALTLLTVASCSSKPEVKYMPAKADGDSRWGLVDAEGNFLFVDEFDHRPSPVVNGFFFVEEGDGYSVYKAEKSPKPVGDLTELKDAGFYNCGVMPVVRRNEHITFVDNEGKVKFTLDKVDGVEVMTCGNIFINDRCSFSTADGKWGAIDSDGNVVIKPKYDSMFAFVEDYTVAVEKDSGNAVIIDKDGNVKSTISEKVRSGMPFIDGHAVIRCGEPEKYEYTYYVVNKDGELDKLPSSVSSVNEWNDKYIVFSAKNTDYKYGIMTIDGEITVRAKYDAIGILPNGKFIGVRNDKYEYINPADGETDSFGDDEIYPAIRDIYQMSKVFDFKFELVESEDDDYQLVGFDGEDRGKEMSDYSTKIALYEIESDYFDYEAVTNDVMKLFDAQGLKGYPFGSQMKNYVDPSRSASSYSYISSIDVPAPTDIPQFSECVVTLGSDEYITLSGEYREGEYVYEFNPSSSVDYFKIELTLKKSREDLGEYIAKALKEKYGVDTDVITLSDGQSNYYATSRCIDQPCRIILKYNSLTISSGAKSWTHASASNAPQAAPEATAEEAPVQGTDTADEAPEATDDSSAK